MHAKAVLCSSITYNTLYLISDLFQFFEWHDLDSNSVETVRLRFAHLALDGGDDVELMYNLTCEAKNT